MDDYREIEIIIAKRYKATANSTRKAIGDFLLNNDSKLPVNVKSNNVDKKNYSPNIISAVKLIRWLQLEGNELYFIFIDYKKTAKGIKIIKDSGLVPVEHLCWNCLTIEAQGWGVIQMPRPLEINSMQDKKEFFRGMKIAYEIYMSKEQRKIKKIKEMIKDF